MHQESTRGPTYDQDGYPTDDTLEALEQMADARDTLNYLAAAWLKAYGSVSPILRDCEAEVVHQEEGERYLRLSTGGWSGNEALIAAFKTNTLVWLVTWCLSARGGLFIFRYPDR